jgi:hypothetical protein
MPPANGSGTTAVCDGVTEKGRCELVGGNEMAESCDLAASQMRKIDCTAMGKHCVLDAHKGAACGALPQPTNPGAPAAKPDGGMSPTPPTPPGTPAKPPTPPTPPTTPTPSPDMARPADMSAPDLCNHGVSYYGYCSGATAIWCDPATGQIITWDCGLDGYACGEWDCAAGAYCCGQTQSAPMMDMAQPAAPSAECLQLGYSGACDGETATWCDNGQIYRVDCVSRGQGCAVNSCASGAYCCDQTPTPTPPEPAPSECEQLGLRGACGGFDGNTVRYCSGGEIVEDDCYTKGQQCQVDTCGYGANCCPY